MKAIAGKSVVALLSAMGAALCLLNASGAKLFCVTQGCHIYSGYGFLGVSFYVLGLAGFLLVLVLTLLYPRFGTPFWLPAALALALALEVLFLFYQFLFWPCVSCLIVGILVVLAALFAVALMRIRGRILLWTLSALSFIFFIYVSLSAVKEAVFKPWAVAGNPDAPVKVYFSPVCPACRETVIRILENPPLATQTAFFPVAKNAQDEARIATFLQGKSGELPLSEIFNEASAEARLTAAQKWRLQVNKMALARMGTATVPVVIAPFLPQAAPPAPVDFATPSDSPFAPPEGPLFGPPSGAAPSLAPTPGCSAFDQAPDCEPSGTH